MSDDLVILVCLAIIFLGIAFCLMIKHKRKKEVDFWLKDNPQARKVLLEKVIGIKSSIIQVQKVNGERAMVKDVAGKTYLYVLPGRNTLLISCACTRPDVLRKSVTELYGPIEFDLDVEHYKDYKISFNKKENQFVVSIIDKSM